MLCPHCKTDPGVRSRSFSNHVRWCSENPKRSVYSERLKAARAAKKNFRNGYTAGTLKECPDSTKKALAEANRDRVWTQESRDKVSAARLRWLRENPDKHPWRSKDKFVSVPCEHLKRRLREEGLTFEEEFMPFEDRFFSLDIAFPEKKVAVEVNGNQHYEVVPNSTRPGRLKRYYRNRHRLLVEGGWTVLEVHYPKAFCEETVSTVKSLVPVTVLDLFMPR